MKLIIGLGNPGKQYINNRHNIGFVIIDYFLNDKETSHINVPDLIGELQRFGANNLFLKPTSYMNNSGPEVSKVINFFKISEEDMLVVHDEVDLPLGEIKLEKGRGSAGHRGVESIINTLGTKDFYRLRIGVNRPPEDLPTDQYVLQDFTAEDHVHLSQIKEQSTKLLEDWLK